MKTTIVAALALAILSAPALAQTISDVDHPNVQNCTIVGPNANNCENLTIQAVHANNGLGDKYSYTGPGLDGTLGTADDVHSSGYSW